MRRKSAGGKGVRAKTAKTTGGWWTTTWANIIKGKREQMEKAGEHPASWVVNRLGTFGAGHERLHSFLIQITGLDARICDYSFPSTTNVEAQDFPLGSLIFAEPDAGLPNECDWDVIFKSFLVSGFDGKREACDVRLGPTSLLGAGLEPCSVMIKVLHDFLCAPLLPSC